MIHNNNKLEIPQKINILIAAFSHEDILLPSLGKDHAVQFTYIWNSFQYHFKHLPTKDFILTTLYSHQYANRTLDKYFLSVHPKIYFHMFSIYETLKYLLKQMNMLTILFSEICLEDQSSFIAIITKPDNLKSMLNNALLVDECLYFTCLNQCPNTHDTQILKNRKSIVDILKVSGLFGDSVLLTLFSNQS